MSVCVCLRTSSSWVLIFALLAPYLAVCPCTKTQVLEEGPLEVPDGSKALAMGLTHVMWAEVDKEPDVAPYWGGGGQGQGGGGQKSLGVGGDGGGGYHLLAHVRSVGWMLCCSVTEWPPTQGNVNRPLHVPLFLSPHTIGRLFPSPSLPPLTPTHPPNMLHHTQQHALRRKATIAGRYLRFLLETGLWVGD